MKASSVHFAAVGMAISVQAAPVNEGTPKLHTTTVPIPTGPLPTGPFTPALLPSTNIPIASSYPIFTITLSGSPGKEPTSLPPCPTPTFSIVTLTAGTASTVTTFYGDGGDPGFTTLGVPTGTPAPRSCIPQTGSSPGKSVPPFNPDTVTSSKTSARAPGFTPSPTGKTVPGFNPETTRKTVPGFNPDTTRKTVPGFNPDTTKAPSLHTSTVPQNTGAATPTGPFTGI